MRQPSVFGNRNFLLFFGGQLISRLGDGIYTLGLVWMMHVLTNSTLLMSLTLAASFLPRVVLGPMAGVLADRWRKRRILIVTDAVRFLLLMALTYLTFSHHVTAWILIVFSFILAAASTLFTPAYTVLQKRIVAEDQLMQANSLQQVSINISQIAGPALAGIFVGTVGIGAAFAIDAGTFIVSLLGLTFVQVSEPVRVHERLSIRALFQEMGGGVAVLKGVPTVRALTPFMLVFNFMLAALENLLLVQFLSNTLGQGPLIIGLVTAAGAVGELLSGTVLVFVQTKWTSTRGLVVNMVITALCITAVGFSPYAWMVGVLMFITGFCMSIVNISFFTGIQQQIPIDALGRVWALLGALFDGATPLSQVVFGELAAIVPLGPLISIMGGMATLAGLGAFLHPAVRSAKSPSEAAVLEPSTLQQVEGSVAEPSGTP
ncbi:MFS transporter [Alicyclobacillus ferrooxydans]|uniref:Major facilitator superfamily (MFS) profile domain-containing protein n=1 Tax=Alicyclobacillus ferrooxydans TaxID=471514 RepID=A0A0N8PPX8_9BACL|nr:MFS transporter [Alicyclobacillus ferrooxydans]KPV45565.1 hypothetical protein AN477_01130 [Alicyclobacillus ferrooxydans]